MYKFLSMEIVKTRFKPDWIAPTCFQYGKRSIKSSIILLYDCDANVTHLVSFKEVNRNYCLIQSFNLIWFLRLFCNWIKLGLKNLHPFADFSFCKAELYYEVYLTYVVSFRKSIKVLTYTFFNLPYNECFNKGFFVCRITLIVICIVTWHRVEWNWISVEINTWMTFDLFFIQSVIAGSWFKLSLI